MAVDLSKLVVKKKISIEDLNGKIVAIDAYNVFYQFLSTIRQQDGMPLVDSNGNITSHLSGLFYRTIELLDNGVKPIYVFDGIPSILKERTIQARIKRREDAYKAWKSAVDEGRIEEAKGFAQASTRITKDIIASGKELLDAMGIGYINAPSEGEAQASFMCKNGLVDIAVSQDYDTMLFGAPIVGRNITISGRRKLPKKNIYINVEPELMYFNDTLEALQINHDQLIWIGLMLGTDFNDGIKGIGPKNALKIAKNSKSINELTSFIKNKYNAEFELDINEVIDLFKKPEVKQLDKIEIDALINIKPSSEKIIDIMCNQHGFDMQRVEKYVNKIIDIKGSPKQRNINNWFE